MIKSNNLSLEHKYIQSATLNGKPWKNLGKSLVFKTNTLATEL